MALDPGIVSHPGPGTAWFDAMALAQWGPWLRPCALLQVWLPLLSNMCFNSAVLDSLASWSKESVPALFTQSGSLVALAANPAAGAL